MRRKHGCLANTQFKGRNTELELALFVYHHFINSLCTLGYKANLMAESNQAEIIVHILDLAIETTILNL